MNHLATKIRYLLRCAIWIVVGAMGGVLAGLTFLIVASRTKLSTEIGGFTLLITSCGFVVVGASLGLLKLTRQ